MGNNYETLVELDFEDGPEYFLPRSGYGLNDALTPPGRWMKSSTSTLRDTFRKISKTRRIQTSPPQQNPEEAEEEEPDDLKLMRTLSSKRNTQWHSYDKRYHLQNIVIRVLEAMGDPPTIDTLYTLNSISEALDERGMRFGQIRKIVSDAIDGSDENGFPMDPIDFFGFDRRDISNEITNEVMRTISDSDERVDIQTGPRGHHTKCLVWRLDLILNSEITKHLSPHIGKTMREIGLDVDQEDKPLSGARSQQVRLTCLKLLPERLRMAVDSLTTWSATISMRKMA